MKNKEISICENCNKEFTYDPRISKGRFCSRDCRYAAHSKIIKESYTDELRKRRSESTKRQMQDPKQIQIRKEKCGKHLEHLSEEELKLAKIRRSEIAKEAMNRPEVRKKISDGVRKNVDYRSIALEVHGTCCQRCGKDLSNDLSSLVVHHIDGDHYIDEITDNSPENLMVLCKSCHSKLHWEMRRNADRFKGQYHFEQAANEILLGLKQMGFEPDYKNFHNTPKRFARAYQEIFEGVIETQEQIDDILSTTFPANGDDTMVVAKDIICFSMCPHHLLPVEYHVCVGYIPNKEGQVLGISKLCRLVEVLAKRPALQESFTQDIVDCLSGIGVYGAIALAEGQHMCMRMRGAKAITSTITTTAVSGIFADDRSSKSEFMSLISDRLRFR